MNRTQGGFHASDGLGPHCVETDDAIYGFSKQAGTWSSLERKPGANFAWIQRAENLAVASMGNWGHVFSAKAGTWSGVDLLNP
mgnify:CR=1 FL=1